MAEWARIIASFVRPGGIFYIIEFHPMADALHDEASANDLRLYYRYFSTGALQFESEGTYADSNAQLKHRTTYLFPHSLGEILTSLIDAGLTIELLHEFSFARRAVLQGMHRGDDGYYRLIDGDGIVPFLFSVKARKPLSK